jgi:protein-S-isoprenylcysteine O-methyltransferase Ste14
MEGAEHMNEAETRAGNIGDTIKIHPPALAGILLLVTAILHLVAGNHTVRPHQLIGLLVVAAGAGLCSYAAALFAAGDTTRKPLGEPACFVSQTPYTFTRNPMYLGLATILFGFAVFFASAVMLLAPVVFVVVIDRIVIPREEETMERLFGQQYVDYKQRVRRWL